MNHIEQYMEQNAIEFDTEYLFHNFYNSEGHMTELKIKINRDFKILVDSACANGSVYRQILIGNAHLEKIKSKTLMEQLKEQGYGWLVDNDGMVRKFYCDDDTWDDKINGNNRFYKFAMQGHIKLIKSDAEREVYRRGLEFEMQEWARENDCLATTEDIGIGVEFDCFNVIVTHNMSDKLRVEFEENEKLKTKTQKEIAKEYGCDASLISHYKKRIYKNGGIYKL